MGSVLAAAILSAACGGSKSPTTPTEVIANYAGNWSGAYSVTGCTQTGGVAAANVCSALGNTPPYSMSLTQSSHNVSGTFTLGSIAFPATGGTVGTDGSLQLNATAINSGVTIVVSWNLRMASSQMSGTISQQWASSTLSGGATVTGTINTALRSATSTLATPSTSQLTLGQLAAAATR